MPGTRSGAAEGRCFPRAYGRSPVAVGVPRRSRQARLGYGLGWHTREGQASHIHPDHPSHPANTEAADTLLLLLDARQHTQPASRTLKLGLGQGFSTPVMRHVSSFIFFLLQPAVRRQIKRIRMINVGQKERGSSRYVLHHVSDMEGLL